MRRTLCSSPQRLGHPLCQLHTSSLPPTTSAVSLTNARTVATVVAATEGMVVVSATTVVVVAPGSRRPASSHHGSAHGLLPGACHGLELLVPTFLEHAPRLRRSRCFNNLTPPSRHFSNHHGTHQASSRRSRPLLYSGKQAPEIGLWNTGASSHMTNNSVTYPFIILHHRLIPHMLLLVTDPNFLFTVPVIPLCIHHHILLFYPLFCIFHT